MGMRITSSMISGGYKSQMNNTLSQLDYYTKRANDLRRYRKFSEDPVTASKAMRMRKIYSQNEDYRNNISTIGDQYAMAEDATMDIKAILDDARERFERASNESTFPKSDLEIYEKTFRGLQKDFLTVVNSKFDDNYVFGGSKATEIPFTVSED